MNKEELLEDEIERLRKLLWLHHGCMCLYGDDGEMQCSNIKRHGFPLDFKRASIENLEKGFKVRLAPEQLKEMNAVFTKHLKPKWQAKPDKEGLWIIEVKSYFYAIYVFKYSGELVFRWGDEIKNQPLSDLDIYKDAKYYYIPETEESE